MRTSVKLKLLNILGDIINPARDYSTTKAIEDLGEDINTVAYSNTTSNSSQYEFEGLYLNFSTGCQKDISLYLTNGSVNILLWNKTDDILTERVFVPEKNWSFPADWELKLEISKTSEACLADILLLTKV